jgi:hypothetical protein
MLKFVNGRLKTGVALGVLALSAAVAVWLWRPPSGAVAAPPLKPIHLQPKAHVADSPEGETGSEDAPLMPVGTKELPEQLDRRQLEAGMQKVKLDKCKHVEEPPFTGTLTVRLTIARSGNVQSVAVLPPAEGTQTGICVAKQVKRDASFPAFRGTLVPTAELTWPFLFSADAK